MKDKKICIKEIAVILMLALVFFFSKSYKNTVEGVKPFVDLNGHCMKVPVVRLYGEDASLSPSSLDEEDESLSPSDLDEEDEVLSPLSLDEEDESLLSPDLDEEDESLSPSSSDKKEVMPSENPSTFDSANAKKISDRIVSKVLSPNISRFDEDQFKNNIIEVTKMLRAQPRLGMALDLKGDVAIVGDIHGDYLCLRKLVKEFEKWLDKDRANRKVLFLGDIFDRGDTTRTFDCLLKFYLRNPGKIFILRGNHEQDDVHPHYKEADYKPDEKYMKKYDAEVQEYCRALPYAAIINNETFVSHAGVPSLFAMKGLDAFLKRETKPADWRDFFIRSDLNERYCIDVMTWPVYQADYDDDKLSCNKGYGRISFGRKMLFSFFDEANKINFVGRGRLNLKSFVVGHEHNGNIFSFDCQSFMRGGSFVRVITSPALNCLGEGSVLVVNGKKEPVLLFTIYKMGYTLRVCCYT